jgi:hypothetical protein
MLHQVHAQYNMLHQVHAQYNMLHQVHAQLIKGQIMTKKQVFFEEL